TAFAGDNKNNAASNAVTYWIFIGAPPAGVRLIFYIFIFLRHGGGGRRENFSLTALLPAGVAWGDPPFRTPNSGQKVESTPRANLRSSVRLRAGRSKAVEVESVMDWMAGG